MAKGKKVSGSDYAAADEKYDKKRTKKDARSMRTAGLALSLKKSEKDEGFSNQPRVKAQKKMKKPVMGKRKAY